MVFENGLHAMEERTESMGSKREARRAHLGFSQRRRMDEDSAGLDLADGHVLQEFGDEGDQYREQERGKTEPTAL